jgi:hypothetical protein
MSDLISIFAERGDLAHLALLLCAVRERAGLVRAARKCASEAALRRFRARARALQPAVWRKLMDTLHSALRSISAEHKADNQAVGRRDHLTVFREFLGHLERASKRAAMKTGKTKSRSGRK